MQPYFIDFEASSFDGFPVQVGWARKAGPFGIMYDTLDIRPTDGWLQDEDQWNPNAEALHGLSRDHLLAKGEIPDIVAARLNTQFRDSTVFCRDLALDTAWADKLYAAAGMNRTWQIAEFEKTMRDSGMPRDLWYDTFYRAFDQMEEGGQDLGPRMRSSAKVLAIQFELIREVGHR